MQNKGFVKVFAVLLTLVCCYYLSFSFVTRYYDNKAKEYAEGWKEKDPSRDEAYYLDSISNEHDKSKFKTWLGETLKECREKEIGLGLDLKGGMTVILEIDAASVIQTLANNDDPQFQEALKQASEENVKGTNKDFVSLFVEKYEAIDKNAKLANIFSSGSLKDRIQPTDNNAKVKEVLNQEMQSAADNSFQILTTRIDRYGVVAPNIQKLNRAERILVELPGIKEPERVKRLMQGSANLEFWRTYNRQEAFPYLSDVDTKSADYVAIAHKGDSVKTVTQETDSTKLALADSSKVADNKQVATVPVETAQSGFTKSLFSYLNMNLPTGSSIGMANKNDTASINAIIRKFRDDYPIDLKFAWGFKAFSIKDMKEDLKAEMQQNFKNAFKEDFREDTYFELYALRGDGTKKGPALEGDVIVSAKADQVPNSSAWGVSMTMNSTGAKKWATITGAELNRSIAILLDGYVYSAPNVNQKIEGGNSQITGNFTIQEARDLENVLKSGKMKAGVHIVQEDIVGPSLGQEAINAGLISFVVALIVLMLYMCLVYGFIPGMIANGALLMNLFITLGVLASIRSVLTLPGIAGLVLALAMAVDANVLIYERTKEELKAGKSVKNAISDGYKHAFSAIFDSNLTSIITGFILYNFGTGAIRGFAITEIIGISASFFTAIFMTRLVYDYALSKGKFQNLTFSSKPLRNFLMDTKINFLNMHRKAYAVSLAVIVLGVVSIFTLGLNSGIDFTGGRNYVVRFDQPVSTQDITDALKPEFGTESMVSVIQIGANNQVRVSTNYKIEDAKDEVEVEIRNKMSAALKDYIAPGKTINDYIQSSQKVGPSVADDMKTAAIGAVLLAILCMGLYILFRFRDVAFSIGTIIAVAHDAAIVIFAYSFFHKIMPFSLEIDQTFIAAILTVVGFSIHDKVVIFDRVRERRRDFPQRLIAVNINDSLNSTLTRTISTTFSTVLVLLCIFVLGGDSIRSFTFAMLIGIILGIYSSIFIATPIAYEMLKRKEDKNKAK